MYHLVNFESLASLRIANMADLALIPMAMFASLAPYADVGGIGFHGEIALALVRTRTLGYFPTLLTVACARRRSLPRSML